MSGSKKVFTTLGSSNHVPEEREAFDYYATDPRAVEMLLELEQFSPVIWEPACGEGHISKVLQAYGYEVISTDLIYRGFGDPEPLDFLKETLDDFEGDIITNPPYSMGLEFVQRALESVRPGGKVAMFLKVQFLEGQKRGEFFRHTPPPRGCLWGGVRGGGGCFGGGKGYRPVRALGWGAKTGGGLLANPPPPKSLYQPFPAGLL